MLGYVKWCTNFIRLYKELDMFSSADLVDIEMCKFTFKVLLYQMPECITSCLKVEPRRYNTRNRNLPRIKPHTTTLTTSFLAKCTICFSKLPDDLS